METLLPHIISIEEVWLALEKVKDPEIPVLSVVDMGIITAVELTGENRDRPKCTVTMTPTFVGCPAIDVMKKNIISEVEQIGLDTTVNVDFETPWTTERMKPEAKAKLEKFGIAPPPLFTGELTLEQLNQVRCPHCGSTDTTLRSSFGSTLCRAIRFCFTCKQGFEQFKPI
jgi:ring-1,2-phenylacetyl-CoA epoxidase subunit PaaD